MPATRSSPGSVNNGSSGDNPSTEGWKGFLEKYGIWILVVVAISVMAGGYYLIKKYGDQTKKKMLEYRKKVRTEERAKAIQQMKAHLQQRGAKHLVQDVGQVPGMGCSSDMEVTSGERCSSSGVGIPTEFTQIGSRSGGNINRVVPGLVQEHSDTFGEDEYDESGDEGEQQQQQQEEQEEEEQDTESRISY